MRFGRVAIAATALLLAAPAEAQSGWHKPDPARIEATERALSRFNSPTLTRFADEKEFRRYLGAVLAADRARSGWYAQARRPIQFAKLQTAGDMQSDAIEPLCPKDDPLCAGYLPDKGEGDIMVTGSRIAAPTNPSITNNQMRNVEEGDIVKQIDRFLLVLQDGRIFVIDTRGEGRRRLVLTDRANVYRDADSDMWYDEMLVFGDRVLITGYSYEEGATELSVFRLDSDGRLGREGVFLVSSNDYYDTSNYATRLIGDNLVIYTPFEVSDMARDSFGWPVVRRWLPEENRYDEIIKSAPLFDAAQIYRPVRDTDEPTVHSVSVCPLGPVDSTRDLECRTTAFVGPDTSQWYVTESDAFLWTTSRGYDSYDPQACDLPPSFETDYGAALLYRVPVDGAAPGVVGTFGVPPDQFSLHSGDGRFRALLKDRVRSCDDEQRKEARLSYLDFPLTGFSDTLRDVARDRYTPLPGVGSHFIANRFTDRYLVYGSLGPHRRGLALQTMPPAYVLPVGHPEAVQDLRIHHTIVRAEQAGNDIVLTGYRDYQGLLVTLIDLDGAPRIASSVQLYERYESEGRSHAFNSLIESDGSGLMGLPTLGRQSRSSRAAWRSSASDLSFLAVDSRGRLSRLGELERRFDYGQDEEDEEDGIAGYSCEVSCIDWYGNSRPIFTDGRVFALTGTELIEGRVYGGEIHEVQRLNIALSTPLRPGVRPN
jgi:hypothetical protein